MKTNGIVIRNSELSVKETMDRIVVFLSIHQVTVYARINQQSEVAKHGIQIKPLEFVLFGDPGKGGNLMTANMLAALDLPLKIIAWEDTNGEVRIAYNDAAYLQQRYLLDPSLAALVNIDTLMSKILG